MMVGGVAASDRMLGPDRALALRFLRALIKGEAYFRRYEDGTVAAMAAHNPKVAQDQLHELYRLLVPGDTGDGTLPLPVAQQMLDLYADILSMPHAQEKPVAAAFDFSLLTEARRSLDAEGWTPAP